MIRSFADRKLERFWDNGSSRGIPSEIVAVLQRKLLHLSVVTSLDMLRIPPANHLEALKGDLKGCHSIRVNRQWRLVFVWDSTDVCDLRLVDYH